MSSSPNYKLAIRAFYALKNLRNAQHAYSRSPHQVAQQEVVEKGKVCDAILREAGEQVHPAPQEQPVLFPPPQGGRR